MSTTECQLICFEAFFAFPIAACTALVWHALSRIYGNTLVASLAELALAPLEVREALFVMHEAAISTSRTWSVCFFTFFPIDLFSAKDS
jgi:hypothetical protein